MEKIPFARAYWLPNSDKMSNVPLSQATRLRKSEVFGYGNYSVNYPIKI
jgi:hypothetical protein